MAKATIGKAPVTLELTPKEASALYGLLATEKWPNNENSAEALNDTFSALLDAGVEEDEEYETDED